MGEYRTKAFQKDETLESLLKEVNDLFDASEKEALKDIEAPQYPVVLIMGAPRCGSTLLYQWLARTNLFAYPSNVMSRFYNTLYLGARIQQVLIDHDYQGENFNFQKEKPYYSKLGKTKGARAPHELWYFWRKFFPYGETHQLTEKQLANFDGKHFRQELAGLEKAFGKPVLMKGMWANWHIDLLNELIPHLLLIHMKRKPEYNMQSLLKTREVFWSDRNRWYAFRPPEYPELKKLDPIDQVASQVYTIHHTINSFFGRLENRQTMTIDYEAFCEEPAIFYQQILEKLGAHDYEINQPYEGPESFEHSNRVRVPEEEFEQYQKAWEQIGQQLENY